MTKLFLHIGMPKNGTSSIQRSLRVNRRILKKYDISVITLGTEQNIELTALFSDSWDSQTSKFLSFIYSGDKKYIKDSIEGRLQKEFNRYNSSSYHIISCEGLAFLSTNEIELMKNKLLKLYSEIEIIIYIRRQDLWVESSYQQRLKHVKYDGRKVLDNYYIERGLYSNLIDKYEGIFDMVTIRRLDPSKLLSNNLIYDFYSVLNFKNIEELKKIKKSNTSLTIEAQDFLENMAILDNSKSQRNIIKMYAEFIKGKTGSRVSLEEKVSYLSNFENDNEKLRKKYFPGDKALFSAPETKIAEQSKLDLYHHKRIINKILCSRFLTVVLKTIYYYKKVDAYSAYDLFLVKFNKVVKNVK